MNGGQPAIRGYLVQTLTALLEALDDQQPWTSVTLEPNIDSHKVDILWQYPDRTKAVQVKSSQNPFAEADIQRWAGELEAWKQADEYELALIGTPGSPSVAKIRRVGKVAVPQSKNLDLPAFKKQAAHQLHGLLPKLGLPTRSAEQLDVLVALLIENLIAGSVYGQTLTRDGLCELLRGWISRSGGGVRIIRVFVSSPDDVKPARAQLDELLAAINRAEGEYHQVRLELFQWEQDIVPQIGPGKRQVIESQSPVCDIFLGILSASFGDGNTKQDFETALDRWHGTGSPWIMFYFDEAPKALRKPQEIQQYLEVSQFRENLESQGVVCGYVGVRGTADAFYEKAGDHLRKLVHLLAPPVPGAKPSAPPVDPTKYLQDLCEKSAYIDIRGLQVGKGQAHRFPIEDLFISLTTTQLSDGGEDDRKGNGRRRRGAQPSAPPAIAESHTVPLHDALRDDRLVIVGDPGAGKSTFLRRIAFALCQTQLRQAPDAAQVRLGLAERTFPVFIRLNELAQHIVHHDGRATAPSADGAAVWLPHYLAAASQDDGWGLHADFFRDQLEKGACTVLLDGLDETPDRITRQRVSRLIENATRAYRGCRFVVTSRPAAYIGEAVLPGFAHARIDPLSDEAVAAFLSRWCQALYLQSRAAADEHCDELLTALRARPEIRRITRNPVMLTALAVVHWNERRLPEQRADLYNSIITWLSRSREQRKGRATADETVAVLQELALAMQDDAGGRKRQVPKRWGAEKIAGKLMKVEGQGGEVTDQRVARAQRFLDEEEVDSGIIVGRGMEVTFWHLTFQEFLAAKAVASRLDAEQRRILFSDPDKIYLPEWREAILLLAGILHEQGPDKVDGFVSAVLDGLAADAELAAQARCAGLLGSVLRDLEPVKYRGADPRYQALLDTVMAVFDGEKSRTVPVEARIEAADALGRAGDPRVDFRWGDYWVTIPAGKFLMGAQADDPKKPNYDRQAQKRESPVHEVHLDEFRIARYPVTVAQYRQFIDDEGYEDERCWKAGGFGKFSEPGAWESQLQYPSRPVVTVSWWEAAAFCAWAGLRLPTEAQWERAARGTEGRTYPWGDESAAPDRLNFAAKIGHPTPVGIFPLGNTADGICDMAGNVWEWCEDWYAEYTDEPLADPHGASGATRRVNRGGSWADDAENCRSAYRYAHEPANRDGHLGFRVAAVPLGPVPRNQHQDERSLERRPRGDVRSAAEPLTPRAGAEGGAATSVQARKK